MHATKRRRTNETSPKPVATLSVTSETESSKDTATNASHRPTEADVVVRNGPSSTIPAKRHAGKSELEADEIIQMHESKSNLFRLETEELLSEVKVNYEKRMGPVDKFLHRLKAVIDEIPEKAAVPVSCPSSTRCDTLVGHQWGM
jgi:U3 small nucleolar RNA-associated protein 22